jgi:hypothetical protein
MWSANFLAILQELVAAGQMRRERSWPPRDGLRKGRQREENVVMGCN